MACSISIETGTSLSAFVAIEPPSQFVPPVLGEHDRRVFGVSGLAHRNVGADGASGLVDAAEITDSGGSRVGCAGDAR